jgi:hypothetical protein
MRRFSGNLRRFAGGEFRGEGDQWRVFQIMG